MVRPFCDVFVYARFVSVCCIYVSAVVCLSVCIHIDTAISALAIFTGDAFFHCVCYAKYVVLARFGRILFTFGLAAVRVVFNLGGVFWCIGFCLLLVVLHCDLRGVVFVLFPLR